MFRIDRDKTQILAEISDVRAATDEVMRSKVDNYEPCNCKLIILILRLLQKRPPKILLPRTMKFTRELKNPT